MTVLPWLSASASLNEMVSLQQQKIDAALSKLKQQRIAIKEAQVPLSKELNSLEAKVKSLRDEVEQGRAVRDSKSVGLETLKAEVAAQRKEYDYISRTLFSEYFANYQAALSAGEQQDFDEPIRQHQLSLENDDLPEIDRLKQSLELIKHSLQRIRSVTGGKRIAGSALDEQGVLVEGTFIQVGPLLYFAGTSPSEVGIIETNKSLQPRLHSLDDSLSVDIATLAQGGEGTLPIDPSLGNALALEQVDDTLGEHLDKGGVWVYPIMGFALLSTIVALIKCIQIFSLRQPAPLVVHDIIKLIREGKAKDAEALASKQPEPCARMLVNAVEHADESIELVEEVMYESMLNTQPKLERYLNIIAVTAAVAPLLGLLGTVTGIINTFDLMKVFGAGDPKPLISGISEALITTELGLVLAIPALIIHALLSRKVAAAMAQMEKLSVAFINGLARSGAK